MAGNVLDILEGVLREDAGGSGKFGASRDGGRRRHKGKDFINPVGGKVSSPVSGEITKIGFPYADDLSFRYVEITDEDNNKHRLFYVKPDADIKRGGRVTKGDLVGKSQDVAKRYRSLGVKNHIHYEILNKEGIPVSP